MFWVKRIIQTIKETMMVRLLVMVSALYFTIAISIPIYGYAATLSGVVIDDVREVAVPGMSIQLSLDENFDIRFYSQSNSDGQFFFTNIPAGRYVMEFFGRYPWAPVFVTAGDKGYSIQPNAIFDIELLANDDLSGYVFDIAIESYVDFFTGNVFSDENDDGEQAINEFGIHSVVVRASNDIGDLVQTQTDDDGYYELILDAGFEWTITEEQPAGWQDGTELALPENQSISVSDDSYSLFTYGGSLFDNLNFPERGLYNLENNVWQLVSLPVAPPTTQNTVQAVFGDDIAGQYGTTWIMYQFNSVTGNYDALTEQSAIVSERGYWIIQITGTTVYLDWPETSTLVSGEMDVVCAGLRARCIKADMVSTAAGITWHLFGQANVNASAIENWRVVSDTVCQSGCMLIQAKTENLLNDVVYTLVDGKYEAMSEDDHVVPWAGFWLSSLPGTANSAIRLLMPLGM